MASARQQRREWLIAGLILAFSVVVWQQWLHTAFAVRTDVPFSQHLPHLLRDGALALPLALVAVRVGSNIAGALRVQGPLATWTRAAVITEIFLLMMIPAIPLHGTIDAALGAGIADDGGVLMHALTEAVVGHVIALPLLALTFAVANGAVRGVKLSPVLIATAVAASGVVLPSPISPTGSVGAAQDSNGCTIGATQRSYDVSAINVDITLNQWGDHDPLGNMYVLDNRIADVRAQETAGTVTPGLRDDAIQALVIRANVGDCLTVNFTNQMTNVPASFNVQGLPYTRNNAPGEVGFNPANGATFGQTISYTFQIPNDPTAEGSYQFNSHIDMRQTMAHGLFGMLVVEPAGSQYFHPEVPGQALESGWEAIIVDPTGIDFREFVIMMHEVGDENTPVLDSLNNDLPEIDPVTGVYRPGARALNYRSEPFMNRLALGGLTPDKSLAYSSYAYGDPSTPIPRSYLGEPTKTRLGHPGSEMFHVYHLHGGGDRWRRNPDLEPGQFAQGLQKVPTPNALSTRLDSQAAGPGETFTLEHECGAGGCQQAAGDFLFHCHIGEHYVAGMWSFWRVHDTVQPDLAQMPADPGYTAPAIAASGTSLDLIGQVVEGKTLLAAVDVVDTNTEMAIEDWAALQLPPPGVTLDDEDATVWDWIIDYPGGDLTQPLILGEPDDTTVWPNYTSTTPGARSPVVFNLNNGRLSWPTFKPHLAKRPPFAPNGHGGAPWLGAQASATRPDGLCVDPTVVPGRRVLQYPITAIDTDIEVVAGSPVPDGMLFVLNENRAAVEANLAPEEPLVIRANVGDCLNLLLTSTQNDADHSGHAKVNIHNHFTQFDPQASDGVITGFSYEQSVRPLSLEDRQLVAAVTPGATVIEVSHANRLRVGIAIGVGLGEGMCDPGTGLAVASPSNTDRMCTEIRHIVAINNDLVTLDAPLVNHHAAGEEVGVEFVQYKWYADVDDGTVFFHDHVDFNNWGRGLFGALIIEPAGSTWRDPVTGAEIRSGATADIHAPPGASVGHGQSGAFRELVAMIHNEAAIKAGDPEGVSSLNLKSEPLADRDADFPFSSVTNGDPITPIFRAYVGDDVVIRGLGVMEREGTFKVTGHRFQEESNLPGATLYDTISIGISEREDVVLDGGAGGDAGIAGDFLVYNSVSTDLEQGGWGLLRVHDTLQGDLQPLPDVAAPPNVPGGFPQQTFTGGAPAAAGPAIDVCPALAPVKTFDVSIFQTTNLQTDLINGGILYALSADQPAIEAGSMDPVPLVLRANAGDCVVVNLTNDLAADRAGLTLGKLIGDPQGSGGSAIGFNFDSSLGSGETRAYRYYADQELGSSMFVDLATPDHQRLGAYGVLVVEPAGATWRNPNTGAPVTSGPTADVLLAAGGGFREQVVLFHEDDERIGQDTMPYPTAVEGFTGFNYQGDPFRSLALNGRLDLNPDESKVFDSDFFGDPATLLRAYVGDDVRYRVGVGHARGSHVWHIDGHRFPWETSHPDSTNLSSKATLDGEMFDAHLVGGAGQGVSGGADYLMYDRRMPFQESGMWGLLRTHSATQNDLLALDTDTGMLRVTTTPALPAQVIVDGIPRDTWSLEWMKIGVGDHEVCFQDIAGFTTPACQNVTVNSGLTTVVDGAYQQNGVLRVDTSPPVPSTITIDGVPANAWGLWTDVAPGTYDVCWGLVAGMDAPPCQPVNVVAGLTTHVTGAFVANVAAPGPTNEGYLRLTTAPAVPSQITIDGNVADSWGLQWVGLSPGQHEICFSDVPGFSTPGCKTVTIVDGLTTTTGAVFTQLGALRVDTSPAAASTILVDLVPRDDWGMWTDIPGGDYDVCFGEANGFTPPCQSVTVFPGSTTHITGIWPP